MLCSLFLAVELHAQTWVATDSLLLQSELSTVSGDALGNIYLAEKDGNLIRYSSHLQQQEIYSHRQISMISVLDASQMLRIFTFYGETHQFQFFNRFLNPLSPPINFRLSGTSQISTAALSSDQMIWLLDEVNLTLMKYNPILEEVVISTDITYYVDRAFDIRSLKEYNNRLFLHQQDEILVFDSMGTFISKLPLKISGSFTISEQKVYYSDNKQIYIYDLKSMQTAFTGIENKEKVNFVLCAGDRLSICSRNKLKTYRRIK